MTQDISAPESALSNPRVSLVTLGPTGAQMLETSDPALTHITHMQGQGTGREASDIKEEPEAAFVGEPRRLTIPTLHQQGSLQVPNCVAQPGSTVISGTQLCLEPVFQSEKLKNPPRAMR